MVVTGRDAAKGREVTDGLAGMGPGRSTFIAGDLATVDGPVEVAKAAEEWLGAVDVLVNNAATGVSGASGDIAIEDWEAIFALNVRGPYLLSTFLMERMVERMGGAVVNVSSTVAFRGWPGYAAYSASKAALHGMTRSWAATYGRRGVRVNAVAPGPVLSPEETTQEALEAWRKFGQDRYGKPEEIAAAVAFLASPEADYIHGTVLAVDGGMVATFGYQAISMITVGRERNRYEDPLGSKGKKEGKGRLFRR